MKLHSIFSTSSYRPMRRIASALSRFALAAILAAGAASCEDDFEPPHLDYMSVGEDVAVTIPISLPKMDVQSRASLDDNYLNAVHSLWIGIFDTNGNMTSRVGDKDSDFGWYVVKDPSNSDIHDLKSVTINAKTGPSHIVAIANIDKSFGVTPQNLTPRKLTELLAEVVTANNPWTAFNEIAVQTYTNNTSLIVPDDYQDNGLVMTGCYFNAPAEHPEDWKIENQKTTTIPGNSSAESTLNGAIHLRRLQSHITFNIQAGKPTEESTEEIVKVDVTGYQICNVPRYVWAYEQKNNFIDASKEENSKDYVEESITLPGVSIIKPDNGPQTFDFWQSENKHISTNLKDYNEREKRSDSNHSIFTSLTGSDEWTPANLASYVVLTCNVTYKDRIKVDTGGNIVDNGNEVLRTGVVRYTIHHGYVGSVNNITTTPDANDFNCYRNSDYIYNVTITGLNDIVVESNRNGERNGVEGIVTDLETATIQLDSHFGQFNIALSYDELFKEVDKPNEDFGFLINSPYNNTVYSTFDNSTDLAQMATESTDRDKHKFYNWIEIKSTDNATTYAKYIPAQGGEYNGAGEDATTRVIPFWKFVKELKDGTLKQNYPYLVPNEGETKYYTIFINEYTYEPRYGEVEDASWGNETKTDEWKEYVNQDPRQFYILTTRATSTDGQSVYARSKYAVSQRSIQSYYTSEDGQTSPTALGIEHINETQGLNMRNNYRSATNRSNGRYNVNLWIQNKGSDWSNFIEEKTLQEIPSVTNLQNGPAIQSLVAGYNPAASSDKFGFTHLPATVALTTGYTLSGNQLSAYDPQPSSTDHKDYIEAINACMNRNRDENGNGTIDPQELKWYVPASGKYLRAILGRHSLETPIMPYEQITPGLPHTVNEQNSRYLIYASNDKVVWAMEGLSASDWGNNQNYSGTNRQPTWQVRCMRNLGTDLTTITETDKVDRAYTYDASTRIVSMKYYDRYSIRQERIDERGNATTSDMPLHIVTSSQNMVYHGFQISATGYIATGLTTGTAIANYIQGNNNYCATYSEGTDTRGWRLPNQKEIAIIVNLKEDYPDIYTTNGTNFSVGNTTASYALTCTYSYFQTDGTSGSDAFDATKYNYYIIASRTDGGTQLTTNNINNNSGQFYIRCVRDIDP